MPNTSDGSTIRTCVLRPCTGVNELNDGDICQQRDMEMLPTASHRSATICSQRFAALRGAENCIIFLMLKLVEKLAFVFFLWIFIFSEFRSSLFILNILKFPWML